MTQHAVATSLIVVLAGGLLACGASAVQSAPCVAGRSRPTMRCDVPLVSPGIFSNESTGEQVFFDGCFWVQLSHSHFPRDPGWCTPSADSGTPVAVRVERDPQGLHANVCGVVRELSILTDGSVADGTGTFRRVPPQDYDCAARELAFGYVEIFDASEAAAIRASWDAALTAAQDREREQE